MSQFSESFHYRGSPKQLMAGAAGASVLPVIVACNDVWTTFFFLNVSRYADAPMHGTRGVMVHWTFAADHEWGADVYADGRRIFRYDHRWDPEPTAGRRRGSLEAAARMLALSECALSKHLPMTVENHDAGTSNAFAFAGALGLPAYDWLSPECTMRVTGCADCPCLSPFEPKGWRCPCCGTTVRAPYPPEPERQPSAPGPLAETGAQLESAIARAIASELIALSPGVTVEDLCDEILQKMEALVVMPNREAWLAQWLIEHPDVDDVFVEGAELWAALIPPE